MKPVLAWLLDRLQERSTVLALISSGATLFGASLSPERAEAILTIGTLVTGAIAAATREGKP